jgi:hypothetical protein
MNTRTIFIILLTGAFAAILLWNGCGKMEGDPLGNQPPNVHFVNIPVNGDTFNYAPVVYWVGDDPDGFVEYYAYIDDTTSASRENPVGFIQSADPSRWVETVETEETIYLLTEIGDTTEHTFFIRAVDDDGAVSAFDPAQHIRTYYRTNQAPYTPEVKWEVWPDDSFATVNVVHDTLFCIDSLTTNWGGIGFLWRSSDPDDRELNIIPLEFNYYLVDDEDNRIDEWSLPDTVWTSDQNLTVYDLDTGWYTLYVWARDDGFTRSDEPGQISFFVIRPEFDRHILLYDETKDDGFGNYDGQAINEFYQSVLDSIPQETLIPQARYTMDGVDVMFWDNSTLGNPLPYDLIHHYSLVIMYDEDSELSGGYVNELEYRANILIDYMNIGGNVWIVGRKLLVGSFGTHRGEIAQTDMPDILVNYFGLSGGYGTRFPQDDEFEFIGAIPAVTGFPTIETDPAITLPPPFNQDSTVSEVDVVTRRISATPSFYNYTFTTYYFNSIFASSQDTVYDENSTVIDSTNYPDYELPPATDSECWIATDNSGLMEVFHVENVTKGVEGELINFLTDAIHVSYPVGDPWEATDVLSVDYRFNPFSTSEFHLQPCGVFKIAMDERFEFLYRTSITTFPMYPLKRTMVDPNTGQVIHPVQELFAVMLTLFFSPYL